MNLADFWNCSLWEFNAAVAGWNLAQAGQKGNPGMSIEAYDKMLERKGYR